jgi:hypothetical protein
MRARVLSLQLPLFFPFRHVVLFSISNFFSADYHHSCLEQLIREIHSIGFMTGSAAVEVIAAPK